jgi:hypothetical protein
MDSLRTGTNINISMMKIVIPHGEGERYKDVLHYYQREKYNRYIKRLITGGGVEGRGYPTHQHPLYISRLVLKLSND